MRWQVACLVLLLAGCGDDEDPSHVTTSGSEPAGHPSSTLVDVTDAWGLDFQHEAGRTSERQLLETMGAGVALFDADTDGVLDLYFVQGGDYRTPEASSVNRLYLNKGLRLEDATTTSRDAADPGYGMGVAVGDGNGDGHEDLYLTNFRADRWLLGDGAGGFDRRVDGPSDDRWTTAATFCDPDADGDLDLFVVAYVAIDVESPPWCGRREEGWRTVCHPDQFEGLSDRLWINDGAGAFHDATRAHGIGDLRGKGLGVVALDVNDDGWTDLYVANDSVENHLWQNLGDGTFADETLFSGLGVNRFGATEAGMGLAAGDLDGDHRPDIVVTNFDHESHSVYRNDGGGFFSDATPSFGIEAVTRMPVGFGVVMSDLDSDRDLDLALVNGHIVERIALYDDAQSWRQRAQVFRNDAGALELDAELGGDFTGAPRVGRGLAVGDLDGDGDEDLVATECGGRARIFENRSPVKPTISIRGLAPGSRVRATYVDGVTLVREAANRTSYLSPSASEVLLPALPKLARIELREPGRDWRPVPVEPEIDVRATRPARSGSSDR